MTITTPDLPAGQCQGQGSLALGVQEDHIKTLDIRCEFVGKRISTSKAKVTWSFNVKKSIFTVELLDSKSSGKKRINVNGHLAKETKVTGRAAVPLHFCSTGLSFELVIAAGKTKTDKDGNVSAYDLLIDGNSFQKIHSAKLEKTRAEHALQQPPTNEETLEPTPDNHVVQNENHNHAQNTMTTSETLNDKNAQLRVSNSSVRVSTVHSPRDQTQPDLNVKMHGGLEENQMHTARFTRALAEEFEKDKSKSKSKSKRQSSVGRKSKSSATTSSVTPESSIQGLTGLETLGHHDDFYSTDNDLLTSVWSSVASSDMSSIASTQFNSALSHFDSSTTTTTSPPSSFTTPTTAHASVSSNGDGDISVAQCVISPQLRAAVPMATVPKLVNPFTGADTSLEKQNELEQLDQEGELAKLRAENAMLKAHIQETPQQCQQYLQQHQQQYPQFPQYPQYPQQCFQQYRCLQQQQFHQQQQRQPMPTLISRAPLCASTRSSLDSVMLMQLNGAAKIKQDYA